MADSVIMMRMSFLKSHIHITACLALLLLFSCKQKRKQTAKQPLIIDQKELECKRKNWNRVPRSAGYVNNVVIKREYKPVKK